MLSKIIGKVSHFAGKVLPGNLKSAVLKPILEQLALNSVREVEMQVKLKGPEKLKLALKLVSNTFQKQFGIPLPVDLIPDYVLNSIVEEAVSKLKDLGEEIKKEDIK